MAKLSNRSFTNIIHPLGIWNIALTHKFVCGYTWTVMKALQLTNIACSVAPVSVLR